MQGRMLAEKCGAYLLPQKLRGRFSRPPFAFLNPTSSVSFSSSLPSSWLPLIYSPFPLFMDHATVFSCN